MLILLTAPDALLRKGVPDDKIVQVLRDARDAGNPVAVVSNHTEPTWFSGSFKGSDVQFVRSVGRQSGDIIPLNANKFSLQPFDVLVLASKDEDIQMGKNGGGVLVAAGWAASTRVQNLGIRVADATQLREVITLTSGWHEHWWFSSDAPRYSVRSLADLSTYYKPDDQQLFAAKLTATVKNGGSQLNALLAITARSLMMGGANTQTDLVWGLFPSSHRSNDDTEILSDFTHRLRTTVSRVRNAKRGEPLFIRHKPSAKRSAGGGPARIDPTEQLATLHLNPYYATNSRLAGKHVIVIDDCVTYGLSFGVAASLLKSAGAASVLGVALGKFGNKLHYFEIDIGVDPFSPIPAGAFKSAAPVHFPGSTSGSAQNSLQLLIP